MRIRLLVSAAALAAALVLPSAVFASPVITSPALWTPPITGGVTSSSAINVEWTDGAAENSFDLWRYDASGAGCLTGLSNATDVSGLLANTVFGFGDTPSEGTYCYFVRADDGVAPSESPGVMITYDATNPGGTVTAPLTGSLGRSVTVQATASDTGGSGVNTVEFQSSPAGAGTWTTFDTDSTGPTYTGTLDTTALVDGADYDLRVLVTDVAGNSAPSAAVTNLTVDSSSPTGMLISPVGGTIVRGTIAATATAADVGSGVASVQFQSSPHLAGTWTTYDTDNTGPGPYSGSLNTTTLGGDGSYDLRARVTDGAGNVTASATVANVLVDNTQPSGSITSPVTSTFVNGTVVTSATASDGSGSGVASVQFQWSPHGLGSWTTYATDNTGPSPYTGNLNTLSLGDGVYDLRALVTDVAGNPAAASAVVANINVDGTAPSGTLTSPVSSATASGSILTTANASDGTGSGVASVQFQWSPHGLGSWTTYATDNTGPSPYTGTLDTTTLGGDGVYDLRVRMSDVLANPASFSTVVVVTYDTAPPSAPSGPIASAALDGSIAVSWGVSGDGTGSGIARYVVRRALSAIAPATAADGDAVCQGLVTSCTDTTAINGKLYSYAVFAVDAAGNTSAAGTTLGVTARDQLAPAVPTGLAAKPGDTVVDLSWTPAGPSDDVAGYVLVAKPGATAPSSDTDGTRVCLTLVATSTACSATGLTNGATYTFGLFALDEALNRSAAAAVTAVPIGPVTDAKAPAAVKALSAKVAGHTVTLTWKNPADKDFDHVEITASERKPASRQAAKRVYSGKGTKAATTLGAGQSRWFTVVAYDRVGNASAPATVHVTIAAASPFGPAPRATVHGKVQLHWPVVKGARYYNVQLYAGKKRILVSWPAGHAVQLPKTKLKRGTRYTWYVWPGLGAKAKAHYGKLIGKNVFTYAG